MRRAVAVALVVALAGCGGGGGDDDTETASEASSTASADADTETEATEPSGGDGGTPTTTEAEADGTTTTAAPSGGGDGGTSGEPATGDGFVPAGTYRYRQTGSVQAGAQSVETPPEGTLVVAPPSGNRQTMQRYLDPEGEPTDIVIEVEGDATRLVETVARQGGQEVRCTFDTPIESPDEVGETATGHADCEGADIEVDIETRVTGTTTVQLDGQTFDALVTETITTTSGQIVSETRSLDHTLIDLGIAAHTEMQISGRFGAVTFSGDGTSDLLSTVPA